ncbi:MAG: ABC transporter ATP-binding protein [Pyrinomonadaceae bacterium]
MQDFKRLIKYLKPHWLNFIFAFIAMIFVGLFQTSTVSLAQPILDKFFNAGGEQLKQLKTENAQMREELGKARGDAETAKVESAQIQEQQQSGKTQPEQVIAKTKTLFNLQKFIPNDPNDWFGAWLAISAMLLIFTVGGGIAEFFSSYLMAKIGQSVILQMREDLYEHLLRQPSAFFERHRTNFLVSRLVTSAAAIESAVSFNLRDVLRESFTLVFLLGAAFYYNWRLTLGALIVAPAIAFLTTKFSRKFRRLAEETFEGNKLLTDAAQEALANQAIVKAYRGERREQARFSEVAKKIARANLRTGKLSAISPTTISLIGIVSISVLLFFGLREVHFGNMDAAQFFTFLFFLLSSYDPMRKISRQHNELSKALAAARDVWSVLDETEVLPEKPNAVELQPLENKIELKNVSFNYQTDDKTILQNINLEIPKGATVALVGASGGGKSSLIKLIQRLYDPTTGAIFWDNTDLRDAKFSSLKKQTALVTQETVLFNETIRYNISYGKFNASDAEVKNAARIAFAHDFIEELPAGYETIVGERGTFLSGGQRQRLAIARAVLVDAPVLILDEATSALDTESEQLVQKALANLMRNRTSIVIAHRLSTVRRADKIVVMERGKIIETGTHFELLEKGGTYKRLYELQFADEEVELMNNRS